MLYLQLKITVPKLVTFEFMYSFLRVTWVRRPQAHALLSCQFVCTYIVLLYLPNKIQVLRLSSCFCYCPCFRALILRYECINEYPVIYFLLLCWLYFLLIALSFGLNGRLPIFVMKCILFSVALPCRNLFRMGLLSTRRRCVCTSRCCTWEFCLGFSFRCALKI